MSRHSVIYSRFSLIYLSILAAFSWIFACLTRRGCPFRSFQYIYIYIILNGKCVRKESKTDASENIKWFYHGGFFSDKNSRLDSFISFLSMVLFFCRILVSVFQRFHRCQSWPRDDRQLVIEIPS